MVTAMGGDIERMRDRTSSMSCNVGTALSPPPLTCPPAARADRPRCLDPVEGLVPRIPEGQQRKA